jgi:hypothetical protein
MFFGESKTELWKNVSPKVVTMMIGTNHLHNVSKNHQPDETADIVLGIKEVIKEIKKGYQIPRSFSFPFSRGKIPPSTDG